MIHHHLAQLSADITVGIAGAGFVGRGLAHQIRLSPNMRVGLVVNRTVEAAVEALVIAGWERAEIVVADTLDAVAAHRGAGRPVATRLVDAFSVPGAAQVTVEATGDVEYGLRVALEAIAGGSHVVSMNFETDATVGALLGRIADTAGVIYTGSDGDQPGVMVRMMNYVSSLGLDIVAAINCKGFLDTHATPDSIRPWAEKQGTSLKMTTAFTDGTKMQVENCCVANATGLIPEVRGMHGVTTDLAGLVTDLADTITTTGVVEYTLGGDFGGGIVVVGSGADPDLAAPYLSYLKMGPGPWYSFFRPWHLVHFETPITIAEVMLGATPTIRANTEPITQVVTIAKRDLAAGVTPDGVGGWDIRGEVDLLERSAGLVPIGIADRGRLTADVADDEPLTFDAFEPDEAAPIVRAWRAQTAGTVPPVHDLLTAWGRDV